MFFRLWGCRHESAGMRVQAWECRHICAYPTQPAPRQPRQRGGGSLVRMTLKWKKNGMMKSKINNYFVKNNCGISVKRLRNNRTKRKCLDMFQTVFTSLLYKKNISSLPFWARRTTVCVGHNLVVTEHPCHSKQFGIDTVNIFLSHTPVHGRWLHAERDVSLRLVPTKQPLRQCLHVEVLPHTL